MLRGVPFSNAKPILPAYSTKSPVQQSQQQEISALLEMSYSWHLTSKIVLQACHSALDCKMITPTMRHVVACYSTGAYFTCIINLFAVML